MDRLSDALAAEPSSELSGMRDSLHGYLAANGSVRRMRAVLDGAPALDRERWRALAELGVQSMLVPEALGGLGLSVRDALAAAEELGRFLQPEPVVSGAWQAALLLASLPASERRDALLREIAAGACVAGVAWPGDASAAESAVAAPADADGWLVATSRSSDSTLAWVRADAPGLRVDRVARADGSALARLQLDGVAIGAGDELAGGQVLDAALERALAATRLLHAAEAVGAARGALALAVDYLGTREQFGRPIGSFQALQHQAVDVLIAVETAAACLADAADAAALRPQAAVAEGARAKARATQAALRAARFAVQAHGAMGITHECDAGLFLKKVLHLASHLGTASQLQGLHFARFSQVQRDAASVDDAAAPAEADAVDLDALDEVGFRAAVRGFALRHCPPGLLHLPRSPKWAEYRPWYQALARRGWIAPAWPREQGGLALPPDRLLAFHEELERLGVTKGNELGLSMVGPLLIRFGTQQQQAHYLPRILSGEHVWCQGYSEPGAGSDLASLRTAAVREGDTFVVTGQKIWTTYAMDATHIFMLVRTARGARRQDGISFLLVELDRPGIRIRPIKDVGGHEKFCEVFFDQVRVPVDALVGEPDRGWEMAKHLLGYERLMIGSPKQSLYLLGQLQRLGRAAGLFEDAAFLAEFAALQLQVRDLQALYRRFADIFRRGEPIPPSIGMLKIAATETWQRLCERFVEHAGAAGGSTGAQTIGGIDFDPVAQLMLCLPGSIYGGTNEIQRNILAKAVLGLPG